VRRFRRSSWAAFFYEDRVLVNIRSLPAGGLDISRTSEVSAASALTGEATLLSQDDLAVLSRLSGERWTSAEELGDEAEVAARLAERGLVVTEAENGRLSELRRRDEELTAEQWDRYAALFHFMARRRPEAVALKPADAERFAPDAESAIESFVAEHGAPPATFHRRRTKRSYALRSDDRPGALYTALRARRTVRTFADSPLSFAELSTILQYTFGCHGYWQNSENLVTLRKTAPSGGAMHPIEAYAIVLNADGVPPGAYHYNVERHTLDRLVEVDRGVAHERLVRAVCGQEFVATAGVVVMLSARFFRSFWKYRRDARAYAVLLMDAGHLAQTFQLVATDLGLGSFVTAAIDGPSADALIGLDGAEEGVIALCGCGHGGEVSVLDVDAVPYLPGTSDLGFSDFPS